MVQVPKEEIKLSTSTPAKEALNISVGPLRTEELAEADRIFRLAFGTYMGFPEPENFHQGFNYIHSRWTTDSTAAFAARSEGKLLGTNFGTNWGSVGFFGPLTIHPEYWDHGIGKRLMEPIMELFSRWHTRHAGLFTFAQSQKHVGLYQRFGFLPRYLTAIMSRPVKPATESFAQLFSKLSEDGQKGALKACRDLTNEVYEGLNVSREINAIQSQKLGDTVLLWDDARLAGLALCHCGEATEAGPGACYVKFAAVRQGANQAGVFEDLLSACESLAAERGLSQLVAGVNTARVEAYQQMLAGGFRTQMQGVAMHRAKDLGYSRAGVYVIDDWR
jgi:GNAT superfamily N-acetyltransferase